MNKDKYLDIIYKNTANSGQGCLSHNIFIFDRIKKKYLINNALSTPCYLSYNRKYDVYSEYSRGGGETGPWHFALYKLKYDTLFCIERLREERIVNCIDSHCNDRIIKIKYTHFCKGDTIVYDSLEESKVIKNIWMSEVYNPSKKCQFIK